MTVKLDIPEDRLGAFQRMRRQLPLEMRDDEQILKKMLAYLKLGGDRMLRHFVSTQKAQFPEDTLLFKPRVVEEVQEPEEGAAQGGAAEGTDGDNGEGEQG